MIKARFGSPRQAASGEITPATIGAFDLGPGEPLVSGQNLNEFMTPGVWYAQNSAVAAAVTNSPVTSTGYKLVVMNTTVGRVMQVVFQNYTAAHVYLRWHNGTAWQAWKTITPA